MDESNYLKSRLENQIEWYDKKSISNQKKFNRLKLLEIFFASLIPLLALIFEVIEHETKLDFISFGIIGAIISAITSIEMFGKYQELWHSYRTTCESLKKEKYLYHANARPYHQPESFNLLVERIESLISKENTNWYEMIRIDKETEIK